MKAFSVALAIFALIVYSAAENNDRAQACRLPVDGGTCRGYFEMYAYDPEQKDCIPFIYGGCDGNSNNFDTLEECRKYCVDN